MLREVDLNEISDGNRYCANDLVKLGCNECEGCSLCCRKMGTSILLDPYDMWQLGREPGMTFEELLSAGRIDLTVADGLILPHLKLQGKEEVCPFLTPAGRCGIHASRPGICRLFPLGRLYEDGRLWYFHQVHECPKQNRTKVRIRKWLQVPSIGQYERFVLDWHDFLEACRGTLARIEEPEEREERRRTLVTALLKVFYQQPYLQEDFYAQFALRLRQADSLRELIE